jgi:tetratricopeptide (TPR) repeat protein
VSLESVTAVPSDVERLIERGRRAIIAGRFADAIAMLRPVLRRAPGYVPALCHTGTAHHCLGQHREAARCFRAAVESAPHFALAWLALGHALFASGDLRSAPTRCARRSTRS